MKSSRQRDSQQRKVFDAEAAMNKGNTFKTADEATKFANTILRSRFYKSLFMVKGSDGKPKRVGVHTVLKRGPNKGKRVDRLVYSYCNLPDSIRIRVKSHFNWQYDHLGSKTIFCDIPSSHLNELTILRYLTYATVGRLEAYHGRGYVRVMLKMIQRFMGVLFHEEAKQIYRKHKCKKNVKRKMPEGWVPPFKRCLPPPQAKLDEGQTPTTQV